MRFAFVLVLLLAAGCVTPPDAPPAPVASDAVLVGPALLHNGGVRGGLSLLHLGEGDEATITFPAGVLVVDAERHARVPDGPVTIGRGEIVQYLPPYGATSVRVGVASGSVSEDVDLALAEGAPLVDGRVVVDLMKIQRDEFPRRTPGEPSYQAAITYFEAYFADLGFEVETFRTPLPPLALPVGPHTESPVSVVAMKRGTDPAGRIYAFGGHYDVVPGTKEGAFDNTGGTMATLALAQAFSRINTSHTLVFAAWGGEEDGLLGSQAWITAHPDLVPLIDLYINYDVSGLAWPVPVMDPAPIVAATGPDGPVGEALAASHASVVADWMQVEAPFVYEGVGQGQATGAGVNAQSDHTPFMSRGIPVLFQFTSRVDEALNLIHSERDTLENMTKYALRGPEGIDTEFNATELAEGEAALAKSFETQMVAGFYLTVLSDNGVLAAPRPASFPLLANGRS